MGLITYRLDPHPDEAALHALWVVAWGSPGPRDFSAILSRGLAHVGAYDGDLLVGFVNVAWDGGVHAFILDTCVDPPYRRRGIGIGLLDLARKAATERGAQWLHVDFEPHLEDFYRRAGFRPTPAGLIHLRP